MKKFIKAYLPIGFIILLWFVFSYPYLLQHKVPFPSLYAVNAFAPWDAYHMYDGSIKNGAMPDIITQIFPWRYFTIQSWKHGQIPLWNPYSFSGTPHLANYQSAVLSPLNLLFFIFSFVDAWSLLVLLQPLLAGLFMYIYVQSLKISKTGSIISAISFMFCGFITTWMDYGTLGYAILFLPLALFAIETYVQTNKVRYVLLLSVSIPLSFFSGHFQISLYFIGFVLIYILYKYFFCYSNLQENTKFESGIRNQELRKKTIIHNSLFVILFLFLAVIIGLLLAMPQILPSLEFYNQSLRSNLFQQIEAIPLGYLPTLLAPDFFGNPVTRNDWFGHYAEWNGYMGLLPLMLGMYAICRVRKSIVRYLIALSIISFLLAFDTPILHLLIALHIPVLSTSAASRIIVLFSFCFAVLAGYGIDALMDDVKNKKIKPVIVWLLSFFVIFAILWIVLFLKLFLPLDKIVVAKQNLKLPTILFLLSIGVLIVTIISYNFSKRLYIYVLLATCYVLLSSFDLLRFATKWQPFDPRQFVFPQTSVAQNFKQKEPYQREYGNYGAEMSMYYQYPAVDGYDPLYINRYGEFIASLDGTYRHADRSVVSFPQNAKYTPQAIKLLDIAYILQKNSDNGKPWGFPFTQYPLSEFTPIYNDGSYTVYKNNIQTAHVLLTQNYIVQTNPQQILNTLFEKNNIRNTLVLEKDPHIPQGGVAGNAQITKYTANQITISAQANRPALLFLLEVFYPGWNAYIDGKKTEVYRADYTFRSIVVPTGKHAIEFRYEPVSFTVGVWLAIIGIVGNTGFSFFLLKGRL